MMAVSIKDFGLKTNRMGRADYYIQMEIFMRENG